MKKLFMSFLFVFVFVSCAFAWPKPQEVANVETTVTVKDLKHAKDIIYRMYYDWSSNKESVSVTDSTEYSITVSYHLKNPSVVIGNWRGNVYYATYNVHNRFDFRPTSTPGIYSLRMSRTVSHVDNYNRTIKQNANIEKCAFSGFLDSVKAEIEKESGTGYQPDPELQAAAKEMAEYLDNPKKYKKEHPQQGKSTSNDTEEEQQEAPEE